MTTSLADIVRLSGVIDIERVVLGPVINCKGNVYTDDLIVM